MDIPAEETRAIAKEAYIYGFRQLSNSIFILRRSGGAENKAHWNQIYNIAPVYTPEDKEIQTPNSDMPYSCIGADLRAEPSVLTVPGIEKGHSYSIRFIDMCTFNFAYVKSRAGRQRRWKAISWPGRDGRATSHRASVT